MNAKRKKSLYVLYNHRYFYLLLVPAFLYYILFCFLPMGGLVLAFKKFQYGYLDSVLSLYKMWTFPSIGLENFIVVFRSAIFRRVIGNTVVISISRIIIEFPVPVVLAILLNEVRHSYLKRFMQTVYTFPHFLSWVVVVTILNGIFRGDGVINKVIVATGAKGVNFLSNPKTFRGLLYATSIWKEAGWGTIIYLAAISGINPELYEAAMVDGANRWHNIRYITWPGIRSTVVIMFILAFSNILNGGFDQIFNMYNGVVQPVADIIDTYIYRTTFSTGSDYSLSTAIGLLKSVIGFILLLSVNKIAKMAGETGWF